MSNRNDILSLKILEAYTRDVGRGVARLDYESMDPLNASTGDVIEIRGKRRTVAKCLPLYPSDENNQAHQMYNDQVCRNTKYRNIGSVETMEYYIKISQSVDVVCYTSER